jgi:Flp pilus assembly protein TadD
MLTIAQRLAAAVQVHEAGRLAEAEALYRGILAEAPLHPHALHLLGVIAYQAGHYAEALDLIGQALTRHGPHPVFYSNLAAVYLELGRLDDAVSCCRQALRLQPTLPDAHRNLGVALMRQGHYAAAETAFHDTLCLQPGHLDARANLGAVLQKMGRFADAMACLQEAVRLAPTHAESHTNLGALLLASDQPELAAEHLRTAVRLRPTSAEAYSNLGLAVRELGRIDEAMQCFRQALHLNPAYPGTHTNLAHTLELQGRIDEARAELHEALRLDPESAPALAGLSGLAASGHYQFTDDELERIQTLLSRKDVPAEHFGQLHFALARHLDRAGAPDEAFAHYRAGNELRKEYVRYRGAAFDPAAHRRMVDRLIAVFSPTYFERTASFGARGADSELPVFVVGMMRSGTTLAEQILASHPQVHGAGELQKLGQLTSGPPARLGTTEDYPECMARLDQQTAQSLAEEYLRELRQRGPTAARVVDKMPVNFLWLGLIATLLPRARIIHCRRDPLDTCLSCYFQNFSQLNAFTLDLQHLGAYYREYERQMAHWAEVLSLPIFELSYEELTADQEAVSRRLVAFCGLEWDDRCLRFHETERLVRTASRLQVRKPMYRSAVGRWKRYESHLQPLIEALRGG